MEQSLLARLLRKWRTFFCGKTLCCCLRKEMEYNDQLPGDALKLFWVYLVGKG